jgi:hypothetical protein
MKRYLLFEWRCYCENGGWNDFIGAYNTIEEIEAIPFDEQHFMRQVIDVVTLEEVVY